MVDRRRAGAVVGVLEVVEIEGAREEAPVVLVSLVQEEHLPRMLSRSYPPRLHPDTDRNRESNQGCPRTR